MNILVTGGAGFIGSNLVRFLINETNSNVINIDSLTYAGNLESLDSISSSDRYSFENIDISDSSSLKKIISQYSPDVIFHLAAESHVDRSIDDPEVFLKTNILGTFNLLKLSSDHINQYSEKRKSKFRFIHVSTDEVFGDLKLNDPPFGETTAYNPSSPYAASKASSDHLVRAWHKTYDFPSIITNCSNNYGPNQFPEKLIPLIIMNAINQKPLPIYGDGSQIRDWLYVEDHVKALHMLAEKGLIGETYNIGSQNEIKNIDLVKKICNVLDQIRPQKSMQYEDLIKYVDDRPGHDKRYAINPKKIFSQIGWQPEEKFDGGLKKTIKWYLENESWCKNIEDGSYLTRQGLLTKK